MFLHVLISPVLVIWGYWWEMKNRGIKEQFGRIKTLRKETMYYSRFRPWFCEVLLVDKTADWLISVTLKLLTVLKNKRIQKFYRSRADWNRVQMYNFRIEKREFKGRPDILKYILEFWSHYQTVKLSFYEHKKQLGSALMIFTFQTNTVDRRWMNGKHDKLA